MFLFQFVKHIIETVIEIYEILLIRWVDPQYPWSQGIGSLIWGSSMTRVKRSGTEDLNAELGNREQKYHNSGLSSGVENSKVCL